jgi:hypothetical protein
VVTHFHKKVFLKIYSQIGAATCKPYAWRPGIAAENQPLVGPVAGENPTGPPADRIRASTMVEYAAGSSGSGSR